MILESRFGISICHEGKSVLHRSFAATVEYPEMKYLYVLKSLSQPEQIYVGSTRDLAQRITYHNSGRCRHTSKFMPWRIVYTERFETDSDALRRERQIKGWTRVKKEALITGNVATLKKLANRRVF